MKNKKKATYNLIKVVCKSHKLELDPILLSGVGSKLNVWRGLYLSEMLTSKKIFWVMIMSNYAKLVGKS